MLGYKGVKETDREASAIRPSPFSILCLRGRVCVVEFQVLLILFAFL